MALKEDISVSIIVPVFNVQQYIENCLESILRQDFEGYEVILVNDASPDNSGAICETYADQHPEVIRYFSLDQNRGVSVARNIGMENMRGDYFCFIDPDDTVPEGGIKSLYDAAVEHGADIVKGNHQIEKSSGIHDARINVKKTVVLHGSECLNELIKHKNVRGHAWGKLYRSSAFKHLRHQEGITITEDLRFCVDAFSTANTLVLTDKNVYTYLIRGDGSTGRKLSSGSYKQWLETISTIVAICNQRKKFKARHAYTTISLNQLLKEARKLPKQEKNTVIPEIERRSAEWRANLFDHIRYSLFDPSLMMKLLWNRSILTRNSGPRS